MKYALTPKYRHRLPQLDGRLFLSDGGIETTLIFHEGWSLPIGEAFTLLETQRGVNALRAYFERYFPMARNIDAGFLLESPTWRANPDWAEKIGFTRERLAEVNREAIALMGELRDAHETEQVPIVISGCIGPRGDGYEPGTLMCPQEAEEYHAFQASIFRDAGADVVSGITMTNVNEAIGVVKAAVAANMPSVISFTVETDGHLPTGMPLKEAIATVDAATDAAPAYYMINCAHPTHFDHVLEPGSRWVDRLRGLRANSSKLSHQELDNAPELDAGDPEELGRQYAALRRQFPHINVLGGCCGTDHRHVGCIAAACGGAIHKPA